MATLGAVLGGYLTYRLGRAGGREALEKRLSKRRSDQAHRTFEKYGFASVAIPAILPPPMPMVPFLMAAGAMQYPTHKFLTALTTGRAVRFFALAWIAHRYGDTVFGFFARYYRPALYTLLGIAVIGALALLFYFLYWRKKKWRREAVRPDQPGRRAA
jgi:membrane protein DedA with SNARE-associated domain